MTKTTDELYRSITDRVIELSKEVASYIEKESLDFSLDTVETKSKNDFVSYVDQEAERQLVRVLKEIMPEAGFVTEEGTAVEHGEDYLWIIDPLDGTTNFIHASTPFAISIALTFNQEPVVGVIYEITRNEVFYAWKGSKAYLNGKEIHVSTADKLSEALIVSGRPHHYMDRYPELLNSVDYFLKNTHGLRLSGSAASDLAYVACGRYDGRFEFNLKPWDIAAGVLIIQQAGGHISDFNGGNNYFKNGSVLASNKGIFEEFKTVIGGLFEY
ncbi:MAG: inositol monophosphatase family protein [Paludibacter sp.]|nr:inositol monophosphatase family protein [Paludibacter sp.]